MDSDCVVMSNEGEVVELSSSRSDLMLTYLSLRGGVPENWQLPFSSEEIRTWDFVQRERALHLYKSVKHIFDYLEPDILHLYPQPHQEEWIAQMIFILQNRGVVIDTSPLGSGKTFMQCLIAEFLDLEVLVIGPANVMTSVWSTMEPTVKKLTMLSYGQLRSVKRGKAVTNLEHGLLRRIETATSVAFAPTDVLREMCKRGVLIVFDEIHNIKNDSAQQRACQVVVGTASEYSTAFVSLLSGSPVDTIQSAVTLMRTIGFIRSKKLVGKEFAYPLGVLTRGPGIYRRPEGLEEMVKVCHSVDPVKTMKVVKSSIVSKEEHAAELVWRLYVDVLKGDISGGSEAPSIPFTNHCRNTFFTFPEKDAKTYGQTVAMLKAKLKYDEATKTVSTGIGVAVQGLEVMELSAAPSIAKDALFRLRTVKNSHVLIFCTYIRTYDLLHSLISPEYEVGIMNGETSKKDRESVHERFQSGDLRVLIVGVRVGGVGLSFQDRQGGRPRYVYINPTWEAILMYQATQRSHRIGAKSDTHTSFVYCDQHPADDLIDSVFGKYSIVRDSLASPTVTFLPSDYPSERRVPGSSVPLAPRTL